LSKTGTEFNVDYKAHRVPQVKIYAFQDINCRWITRREGEATEGVAGKGG